MRLLLILLFWASTVQAQKHGYVWTFADSCGLDFNTQGEPMFFMSRVKSNGSSETQGSISDSSGRLEAYLACEQRNLDTYLPEVATIYNGTHQPYINGDSIYAGSIYSGGALFLPLAYHNRKYLLFTISQDPQGVPPGNIYAPSHLYMHVLDAEINKVVLKNKLIFDGALTDILYATYHSNGTDWWILGRYRFSNSFVGFLVSDTLVKGPFYQTIGAVPTPEQIATGLLMDSDGGFSQNSKYLLNVGHDTKVLELFDFNRCTGILSNYRILPIDILLKEENVWWNSTRIWPGAFSGNSRYIYI